MALAALPDLSAKVGRYFAADGFTLMPMIYSFCPRCGRPETCRLGDVPGWCLRCLKTANATSDDLRAIAAQDYAGLRLFKVRDYGIMLRSNLREHYGTHVQQA